MISSLANYITDIFIKNEIIQLKKADICRYGLEIIVAGIINLIIAFAISYPFGMCTQCMCFCICFIYLRRYTGGYHAKTYFSCNVIFALNVLILVAVLINRNVYTERVHIIFCVISLIVIIHFSPIENFNKKISVEKKKKYHKIAMQISSLEVSSSMFFLQNDVEISIAIGMALISVAIAMVIEKLRKGG